MPIADRAELAACNRALDYVPEDVVMVILAAAPLPDREHQHSILSLSPKRTMAIIESLLDKALNGPRVVGRQSERTLPVRMSFPDWW
jgi:hypothetical protein